MHVLTPRCGIKFATNQHLFAKKLWFVVCNNHWILHQFKLTTSALVVCLHHVPTPIHLQRRGGRHVPRNGSSARQTPKPKDYTEKRVSATDRGYKREGIRLRHLGPHTAVMSALNALRCLWAPSSKDIPYRALDVYRSKQTTKPPKP